MNLPFAIVPMEAFFDNRLSKIQMRVLGAILTFRNRNTNLCCPKRDQISKRLGGMPLPKISTATTQLVELGWLKKKGKGGHSKSTEYIFCVPETVTELVTVAMQETVTEKGTVNKQTTVPKKGTVTESVTTTVPESGTRNKQTNKPTKDRRFVVL